MEIPHATPPDVIFVFTIHVIVTEHFNSMSAYIYLYDLSFTWDYMYDT